MTNAANKPVNTYVFPELPQYKKGWVPVLEMAKLALNQEDFQEDLLCTAVSTGARMCEAQRGGVKWLELGAEIKDAISDSLGRHLTVVTWHRFTLNKEISRFKCPDRRVKAYKAYRLAWIDHIIMKCEGE